MPPAEAPATTGTSNRIPPELRRSQILRCATDLFAARGFNLTTMDDVARSAHITKRTLYRYFPSKDELLYEIHDRFTRRALVPGDPPGADHPVAAFSAMVRRHVDLVTAHNKEIGVFFEERKHLRGRHATLIEQQRDAYERHAVDIIRLGSESGTFRPLPARPVGRAILGTLTEIYQWYRVEGAWTAGDIADRYVDILLDGLAVDRSRPFGRDAGYEPSVVVEARGRPGAERVRSAAIREFARAGYHATSMTDLANVADVSKGAVVYHAGYKLRLLEDIHRATLVAAMKTLRAAEPNRGDAIDALHRMLIAHLSFLGEHRDGIAVVNDNLRYLEPAVRNRIERLRDRWIGVFHATIDRGVDEGQLRRLDTGFVTRVLVGILNSTVQWFDPNGRVPADELADIYARLLIFGLRSSDPAELRPRRSRSSRVTGARRGITTGTEPPVVQPRD